jgi:mRNA-degrading endonuclease toxin of MazEF toxin-antitoxin module
MINLIFKKMNHEEKINYMRIAAGICCYSFKKEHLDLLVSLYELVTKKEGKTNVDEIVDVELAVKEREKERLKNEEINKINKAIIE